MTAEQMLAVADELSKKLNRLTEIRAKAKDENRDLSRRERAEVETIKQEAAKMREQIDVDPRALQWNAPTGPTRYEGAGDTLTREQRVADWLRERGDYHGGGFERTERENLSLGKMVRGAVTGNWRDAELEQRAMSESVLANGGYALGPALSARVLDRVRNQMQVMKAGATTVPMANQQLYLARLAGGASASWKAEGQPITDSTPSFERVVLTAKTLPVLVKISAELFEDLSPEATETIEREISLALSLELDRACLRGSGADPEPTGIRFQSGVTVTSLGAGGATPNWDNVIDAVAVVRAANIEPDAILWASRTQQTFDKAKDLQKEQVPRAASFPRGDSAPLDESAAGEPR